MRGWLLIALILMGCLFALTGVRQFLVDPVPAMSANGVWFVLQVLPLLLVLPGVLRLNRNALFFTTLASCLYLIHGILGVADWELPVFATLEIGFALGLFVAVCVVMRKIGPQPEA